MLLLQGIPSLLMAIARLALAISLALLLPQIMRGATAHGSADLFQGETPFRAIAYDIPDGAWPNTLPPLCLLARDLPLIAETGATAVYTRGAPPADGDHVFLSLLASTRLHWVAAYPLPEDVDRGKPLLTQKQRILDRFAAFAERYGGNRNLRAVALDFGKEHLEESAAMAPEFAAILKRYFPANTPRLGHVAYTASRLEVTPPGVQFWIYRFENSLPTNITRLSLRQRTTLPVVFDLTEVATQLVPPENAPPGVVQPSWRDYLSLFRGGDASQPLLTLRFLGKRQLSSSSTAIANNGATTTTVSYRYLRDGLFVGIRDSSLLENLQPTLFSVQQREDWGANALENHAAAPSVTRVSNAATDGPDLSPGTQISLEGNLFQTKPTAWGSAEWPLHAGARCVCVAGRPVPMRQLAAVSATGQLPWLLEPGATELRLIREGVASAPVPLSLKTYSPGIFAKDMQRSGANALNGCSADSATGLKPGETLQLRVTGAGPLNGGLGAWKVFLDGAEAQLLTAGLDSEEPGAARIAIQVPAQALAPAKPGLYLVRGDHASNILPVSYAGDARPTVGLVASAASIQLSPGSLSDVVRIRTEGLNGFCGKVDFEVMGLPQGVKAIIRPVDAGTEATLQLSADASATPVEKHRIFLYAVPAQGDLQLLTLDLSVVTKREAAELVVQSAGFAAGPSAAFLLDGQLVPGMATPPLQGMFLLVIHPVTGVASPVEVYNTYRMPADSDALEARLKGLPTKTIIAMAIADDATLWMSPSLRATLLSRFGSMLVHKIAYQHSWAFIARADTTIAIAEASAATQMVEVKATLKFGQ
ncbi:MAG: hypothetical protein MUF01_07135 [Bryobacterales bacterium]|jgi:uncharacterized protein (TIGR03437 family)|nr:hypothetical protein [Bryobacterales bacterium]